MRLHSLSLWASVCLVADRAQAITMDPTNANEIKSAASQVAYGMMKYYTGNHTGDVPGNLPSPYYWWEAGAMFGHLIDYWYYTGDTSYNAEIVQAIDWQASTSGNFMPSNQTTTEGNDDQVFWAFTAMTAAEHNFQSPEAGYPSWVAMAQAVFNEQANRWDDQTCGGGLRWQIFPTNNGYDYRNTVANGGLFQLASRLARYTQNQTYVDWAEKSWAWFENSVLFDNATFQINDGTSDLQNCTQADHQQWSYNYGMYLGGLAFIYNHTTDAKWLPYINGVVNATLDIFFPPKFGDHIFVEVTCEPLGNCDTDAYTFKAHTSRWLALTAQLVPTTASTIWPYLQKSGKGAAGQCDGGTDGITCGFEWNTTTWDGTYGVGQQMSALSAIGANMLYVDNTLLPPYTVSTGGTSKSDGSAGTETGAGSDVPPIYTRTITTSDRAGAGIITAIALVLTLGGAAWLLVS